MSRHLFLLTGFRPLPSSLLAKIPDRKKLKLLPLHKQKTREKIKVWFSSPPDELRECSDVPCHNYINVCLFDGTKKYFVDKTFYSSLSSLICSLPGVFRLYDEWVVEPFIKLFNISVYLVENFPQKLTLPQSLKLNDLFTSILAFFVIALIYGLTYQISTFFHSVVVDAHMKWKMRNIMNIHIM